MYTEIRNDYMEEGRLDHGFSAIYIDVWKTNDDNEEGKSVAKVYGSNINNVPIIFHDYIDNTASANKSVKKAIEEAKLEMMDYLEDK